MIKKLFTILIFFLSIKSFGQNTIKTTIQIDESFIDSTSNNLIVKIKYKNETDTLKYFTVNGHLTLPWIYKNMDFFEVFYKGYLVNMSLMAAEVEGKSLFNEFNHKWNIIIDNFPYNNDTKKLFPKIKKPEYSFIINTEGGYSFFGIGKK